MKRESNKINNPTNEEEQTKQTNKEKQAKKQEKQKDRERKRDSKQTFNCKSFLIVCIEYSVPTSSIICIAHPGSISTLRIFSISRTFSENKEEVKYKGRFLTIIKDFGLGFDGPIQKNDFKCNKFVDFCILLIKKFCNIFLFLWF